MQEITGIRDKLRADVEGLDGGYTTVAKILGKSHVFVHKTLRANNTPRLSTLEEIKRAVDIATTDQNKRLAKLSA
nr:hypothetical protein [uncultured Arsenicibacter sp.]